MNAREWGERIRSGMKVDMSNIGVLVADFAAAEAEARWIINHVRSRFIGSQEWNRRAEKFLKEVG